MPDTKNITEHSGKKYLRTIHSAVCRHDAIQVDVYAVLQAFHVHNPAVAHAVKKLLCAGQRGKGDRKKDLQEAIDALSRAVELNDNEPGVPPELGAVSAPEAVEHAIVTVTDRVPGPPDPPKPPQRREFA